jgi:hypothetical protein
MVQVGELTGKEDSHHRDIWCFEILISTLLLHPPYLRPRRLKVQVRGP